MSVYEDRLVVIYKRDGLNLIPYKVAIAKYNLMKGTFLIKNGEFEGKNNSDFCILHAEPDFIFPNFSEDIITSEEKNSDSEYFAYVFDDDFICETSKIISGSKEAAYIFIAQNFKEKQLKNNGLDSWVVSDTKSFDSLFEDSWRKKDIEDMLYGENLVASTLPGISKADIKILKSPGVFSGLDPETRRSLEEYISRKEAMLNNDIDVNQIIDEVSAKIIHQEEAIRTLATNIKFNQDLISKLSESESMDLAILDSTKVAILLDGSTGTGKTAIAKDIASKLKLPIVITNANSFSETGYVGPTITDILRKLLDQANGDVELAERGIVFLDEIDKIVSSDNVIGRDMKEGVQDELLTFIGGGEYDVRGDNLQDILRGSTKFDTSKLTFILSGAFTNLRERKIKENDAKNKPLGFSNKDENSFERVYSISPEDYIKEGLKREFFGRIKVLASTKSYTIEDLKDILLKSKISPLKNFEMVVKIYGYKGITYDDDFIDEVAREAYEMNTGARALQTIMSGIQNKMLLDIMNQEYDLSSPIHLGKELITDYKKSSLRKY